MTAFDQEIAKGLGLEFSALCGSYKYSVFGGHTAVVEGHGGIAIFSPAQISFRLKKRRLVITGENLTLKSLTKNYAVVCGEIKSVGVEDA